MVATLTSATSVSWSANTLLALAAGDVFPYQLPLVVGLPSASGTRNAIVNAVLPITGAPDGALTRNKFGTSSLAATGTVSSTVRFSPATNVSAFVTTTLSGTIRRNQFVSATTVMTALSIPVMNGALLIRSALELTATSSAAGTRKAVVNALLANTATMIGHILLGAEVEGLQTVNAGLSSGIDWSTYGAAQLPISAMPSASATRHQYTNSGIAVSATAISVMSHRQFINAQTSTVALPVSCANLDALLEATHTIDCISDIRFIKNMSLSALLNISGFSEQIAGLDALLDANTDINSLSQIIAIRNQFSDIDSVTATITTIEAILLDAVTGAVLVVPFGLYAEVTELVGTNLFPFYL